MSTEAAKPTSTHSLCPTHQVFDSLIPSSLRAITLGQPDSGKSTLVGVLTTGKCDDGRGSARISVSAHPHEIESGRTSSIVSHVVGYSSSAPHIVYGGSARQGAVPGAALSAAPASAGSKAKTRAWAWVTTQAERVVTLVDLAGHERYLKTTVTGMAGEGGDLGLVVVNAGSGVSTMTREHMQACQMLALPMAVVVTKTDKVDVTNVRQTKREVDAACRHLGRRPVLVRSEADAVRCARLLERGVVPVLFLSCVSGQHVSMLHALLACAEGGRRVGRCVHGWPFEHKAGQASAQAAGVSAADWQPDVEAPLRTYNPYRLAHEHAHTGVIGAVGDTAAAAHAVVTPAEAQHLSAPASVPAPELSPAASSADSIAVPPADAVTAQWATAPDPPCACHSPPFRLSVGDVFTSQHGGVIVSGLLLAGTIAVGRGAWLGPLRGGRYVGVRVRSVHVNRAECTEAHPGTIVSLLITGDKDRERARDRRRKRADVELSRRTVTKGMVVVGGEYPRPARVFDVLFCVGTLKNTIQAKYEAVVHCNNARGTAEVVGAVAAGPSVEALLSDRNDVWWRGRTAAGESAGEAGTESVLTVVDSHNCRFGMARAVWSSIEGEWEEVGEEEVGERGKGKAEAAEGAEGEGKDDASARAREAKKDKREKKEKKDKKDKKELRERRERGRADERVGAVDKLMLGFTSVGAGATPEELRARERHRRHAHGHWGAAASGAGDEEEEGLPATDSGGGMVTAAAEVDTGVCVRGGERGVLRLRMVHGPADVRVGDPIVVRDGNVKAGGVVVRVG